MSTRFHTRTKILKDTVTTTANPGEHPETDDFVLTRPGKESNRFYDDYSSHFIGATAADVRALYGAPLITLEGQIDYGDILEYVRHFENIVNTLDTTTDDPKVVEVMDVLRYLNGEVTLIEIHGNEDLSLLTRRLVKLDLMIQRRGHPRRTHNHGAHDRGAHDQNTDEIIGQLWRDYEAITTALISFSSTTNPATQKQEDTIIAAAVNTVTAKVADLEDTLRAVGEQITDAASQAAQTRLIEALGLDIDSGDTSADDEAGKVGGDNPDTRDEVSDHSSAQHDKELTDLIADKTHRGAYARELILAGMGSREVVTRVQNMFDF